ncbi:unnamed protein product [Penicillium nalgiovense]|uniref:Large ribosomal subunit protein uL23m n=1 Tax=Penicillium nalgiovense TaxID=60175 RepID=A0A9W4HBX9_PENNA|nr:unnamed protein product [Penicillium nalgiovense]CAG7952354.1 unnamed protein product [Penicillium nalgiovense]CAG7961598.1 unnamed protein product [Penicillium nalgiovense]CAG7963196.1 unnamed protein product [Penicillium nalgiovense]CAG7967329.1 unnamed protein product [Penicillium nalgiovense]
MVRLNSVQGKALRRLQNQAGVQQPPKSKWPSVVGKPVYLPQFRIALVRTPNLTPRYAQFRVPLNFNKFDLRSYLWHLYGVGTLSIRSYVQAQPITRISRDGKGFGPWRRPKSQKRMTVELKEPFVYPEEPKDLTPYVTPTFNLPVLFKFHSSVFPLSIWEHESWSKAEKWQIDQQEKENPKPNKGEEADQQLRDAYKEQAKALLENKATWRPTWKALGLEPHQAAKNGAFARAPTLPAWYGKGRKHGSR